jgi:co-chaperonin GroES (HSP10)
LIKRGTKNSVLVEIEKLSEDEFKLSSGVKIFTNPAYAAKQRGELQLDIDADNQRIYGTCVAVPEFLVRGDLIKYEEGDYRHLDSVEPEVQVGDRVYFSYVSVNKGNLIEYEGKFYCNINYTSILCVVRNEKEIIPIAGNIMCEEYFGRDVSLTKVGGDKFYGEKRKSGLIGVIAKPPERYGIVRIIGAPLKGDKIEVQPGDIVMFPDKFGFKNNIEGKEYLFIRYWDVHAIVGNEKESVI